MKHKCSPNKDWEDIPYKIFRNKNKEWEIEAGSGYHNIGPINYCPFCGQRLPTGTCPICLKNDAELICEECVKKHKTTYRKILDKIKTHL